MEIPAVIQEWIRAEPVCVMRPFHVKNPIKKNLGSLMAFYYRGASSLMETMVNTVPDTTIYRIGKIFGSTSKAKSTIATSLGENPILIVIFTVWMLLAGFFLVLIGLHFVCRLLYSRKSMQLSDQRILWATLSFGLCFVTSLIGLTFYYTSLSRIREGIEDFPLQLNRTTSDFSGFILYLNETINCQHENEYEDLLKEINEVLDEIRLKVQEIKSMMKVYELQKNCTRISDILGYTIYFPIILMILTTAGLAVIIGSWKFYLADVFGSGNFYKTNERFESLKSNHDILVRMAASALAGAGYVAMVIGALLCVIVAFCFVMAFVAMLVCMGFFLDDDLRLFNAVPNLQYRAKFGTQEIKYSLYYTFYKCKNGYQFFDATNGYRLMAATELEKKFQQSRRKDLALQLQKYHMTPGFVEQALLQFSNLAIANTIAKKEFRDDQGKSLQKSVSTMYNSLMDAFSNIFKAVGELSPQCEHIMRIWFVLGGYVCDWISAPAQGLWVASMICVLASSATYHAFFNLARFLYEHTESAQEAYQREKLYLAKLDFVHRKMLKQDVPGSASASPEAATVNAVTQSEQPSAQISVNDAGKTEKKSDFLRDLKEMLMRLKKNKN
ncbi:hypothetical protein V3C99_000029 [Haemonchus contortus]